MSRRFARATILGAAAVIFLFLISVSTRFDPNSIDFHHWSGIPLPPCFVDAKQCGGHLLGTDQLGRDVLARLVRGGQVSIGLSLLAEVFALILGIVFGVVARYGGTIVKFVVMRTGDALSCFPAWPFLVVIVVLGTPPTKAALSGFALAVIAAILFSPQILHLVASERNVPHTIRAVTNQAATDLRRIIVLLATVDFFGLGIQPPTASWGNMLTDSQELFSIGWWALVFPAGCLVSALFTIEIVRRRSLASDGDRHGPLRISA